METGNGTNIISLVSSRADSLTDSGMVQGISNIQQHEPDVFAQPVPVPWSESLARSLIPMESYSQYTESERLSFHWRLIVTGLIPKLTMY